MSDLVGKPEDRFSRVAAHLYFYYAGDEFEFHYTILYSNIYELGHVSHNLISLLYSKPIFHNMI